jgi:hypothetical protein
MRRSFVRLLILPLLAGCTSAELNAPLSDVPGMSAAKAAGGTDSRATWSFYSTLSDNVTPTLLHGDGLAADGITPADPSVFEGGRCRVRATINWYNTSPPPSGDAAFNPSDGTADPTCSTLRRQVVVIGGTSRQVSWTGVVKQIMQLSLGQSRLQNLNWGPATADLPCDRLIYTAEVGSQVRVTRTLGDANGTSGEWIVESAGNHGAGCYLVSSKGGGSATWTGVSYYLPFRARIVEIR